MLKKKLCRNWPLSGMHVVTFCTYPEPHTHVSLVPHMVLLSTQVLEGFLHDSPKVAENTEKIL